MAESESGAATKRLPKVVIGLSGVTASGKSAVAAMLAEIGFQQTSIGDALRTELGKLGLRVTRENMQFMGDNIVAKHGNGALGIRVRTHILEKGGPRWVVEGIANPLEAAELSKLPNFILLGVEAGFEQIYIRMANRRLRANLNTRVALEEQYYQQLGEENKGGYWQIGRCLELADYTIDNHRQFEADADIKSTDLYRQVARFLAQRGVTGRPWETEANE